MSHFNFFYVLVEQFWSSAWVCGGLRPGVSWLICEDISLAIELESLTLLGLLSFHSNQSLMELPLMEEHQPEEMTDNLTRVCAANQIPLNCSNKNLSTKNPMTDFSLLSIYGRLFSFKLYVFGFFELGTKTEKMHFFPRLKQSSIFPVPCLWIWWFSMVVRHFFSF